MRFGCPEIYSGSHFFSTYPTIIDNFAKNINKMNKPINLQESRWHDVQNQDYQIAILPWGATEAHNYHLPYGTDTLLAEHVAVKASEIAWDKGAKCVVLPPIGYGINSGQMDIKLCMNINPSTQMALIRDILQVLNGHGIKKLVIFSGHGGNDFVPMVRELGLQYPDFIMVATKWWNAAEPNKHFVEPGDHAGELETSCMQAFRPELVYPLDMAGDGHERKMKIAAFREKWAWSPRRWRYVTDSTGCGCPYEATPEKGKIYLEKCIDKVADFLVEFSKVKKERDLYED